MGLLLVMQDEALVAAEESRILRDAGKQGAVRFLDETLDTLDVGQRSEAA